MASNAFSLDCINRSGISLLYFKSNCYNTVPVQILTLLTDFAIYLRPKHDEKLLG